MKHMNFARKLYEIVTYTTNQTDGKFMNYSQILSWHPDRDTTFVVWDKEQFMQHIAPRFFPTQNAFRSLERLLNMWTFVRVPTEESRLNRMRGSKGNNLRVFHQPDFSRSDASRLRNIERRNVPGGSNSNNVPPPNRKARPQTMAPIVPRQSDSRSTSVPMAAAATVPGMGQQPALPSPSAIPRTQQQRFGADATATALPAGARTFPTNPPVAGRKRAREELGSSLHPNRTIPPPPPRPQRWQVSGQFDDADDDDNNGTGENHMDDDDEEEDDALVF